MRDTGVRRGKKRKNCEICPGERGGLLCKQKLEATGGAKRGKNAKYAPQEVEKREQDERYRGQAGQKEGKLQNMPRKG